MGLTPAQERVYQFLQDHMDAHGHSPFYEEIRKQLDFRSLTSVYKHLKQSERRGISKALGRIKSSLWI